MIKQKLSSNFYIYIAVMAVCLVIFPYGTYGILTNTITLKNGGALNPTEKIFITLLGSLVTLFSSVSIIPAIRQAQMGYAFIIDNQGIHSTLSVMGAKIFTLVLPIRKIPYDAIETAYMEGSTVTLILDKDKLEVNSLIKPLIRKKYQFVYRFAKYDEMVLRKLFNKYTNNRFFISKEDLKNKILDIIPASAEITSFEFEDEFYIENIMVCIRYCGVDYSFDASMGEVYYNGNSVFEKNGKYSDKESIYPDLLKVIENTFNS